MKVLVIGSGGREHTICWKLNQSDKVTKLYAAPGNPGISEIAECVSIKVDEIEELVAYAKDNNIEFTVVGPELPLALGIVDRFKEEGLSIFGPTKAAANLEGSKSFAKEIMVAAGVPTADYQEFTELEPLIKFIESKDGKIVLKADGLAAGKGVFVCEDLEYAKNSAKELYNDFNASKVVAEELLDGVEASYIVATDGKRVVPFAASHDYKRIFDNQEGPNTGGMGTVSPTPNLSEEQEKWALENVINPVVREMENRGIPFSGFLYAGLMISKSGDIKVLEFNARLGDPETQVILRRMEGDLFELLYCLAEGKEELPKQTFNRNSAVCVVLASEGYPESPVKGDEIVGIGEANVNETAEVFHAGTALKEGQLVTAGGRVLNVTCFGKDLDEAIKNTYEAVSKIRFRGMQHRNDIGK